RFDVTGTARKRVRRALFLLDVEYLQHRHALRDAAVDEHLQPLDEARRIGLGPVGTLEEGLLGVDDEQSGFHGEPPLVGGHHAAAGAGRPVPAPPFSGQKWTSGRTPRYFFFSCSLAPARMPGNA